MDPIQKTSLVRKGSLRKPPVIKQTKSSMLRMLNANPLLALDENARKELGITDLSLLQKEYRDILLPSTNGLTCSNTAKECKENKNIENDFPSTKIVDGTNCSIGSVSKRTVPIPTKMNFKAIPGKDTVPKNSLNDNPLLNIQPNDLKNVGSKFGYAKSAITKNTIKCGTTNLGNGILRSEVSQKEKHLNETAKPTLNNDEKRLPNVEEHKISRNASNKKTFDQRIVNGILLLDKAKKSNVSNASSRSSRMTLSSLHRQRSHVSTSTLPTSKRRSASAEKYNTNSCLEQSNMTLTQSLNNINDFSKSIESNLHLANSTISPITKEKEHDTFKTPRLYSRRSVCMIPSTTKRLSELYSSTPGSSDLKRRLNEWLSKKGKSLGTYHHLKCFGIHKNEKIICKKEETCIDVKNEEENKENIEIDLAKNDSYESLGIILEGQESKDGSYLNSIQTNGIHIPYESIARDALDDLFKLIQDGYPNELCSAWLNMIQKKCQHLEEEPQYWECRAALEQREENIINAVECYRTAIIKGAEIKNVDESLEQLLQKFSLLNINSAVGENSNVNAKIINEARNVFKSTIIRFAVQERDIRKKDAGTTAKTLYVTPVRRSNRLSTNGKNTPGVKLYNSLHDIQDEEEIIFRKNNCLATRYK